MADPLVLLLLYLEVRRQHCSKCKVLGRQHLVLEPSRRTFLIMKTGTRLLLELLRALRYSRNSKLFSLERIVMALWFDAIRFESTSTRSNIVTKQIQSLIWDCHQGCYCRGFVSAMRSSERYVCVAKQQSSAQSFEIAMRRTSKLSLSGTSAPVSGSGNDACGQTAFLQ